MIRVTQKRRFVGYLAFFQPHTVPIKCYCKILQKRRFHPESLCSSSSIIFRKQAKSVENFEEVLQIFQEMNEKSVLSKIPMHTQQWRYTTLRPGELRPQPKDSVRMFMATETYLKFASVLAPQFAQSTVGQ
jgi:hypothetical protein